MVIGSNDRASEILYPRSPNRGHYRRIKKAARSGRLFFAQNLLAYLVADIAASPSSLRFSTSILIKSSLLGFFPRTISS